MPEGCSVPEPHHRRGWPAARGSPPRCGLRPGSGPIQGAAVARGCRARAAEPPPSSFSPSHVSITPSAGVTVLLLLSALTLSASLDVPPSPARPRRWPLAPPAPSPQPGWRWAPRRGLRDGDGTGTFSPVGSGRGEGGSTASPGVTSFPCGFQGCFETCLLGHGGGVLF